MKTAIKCGIAVGIGSFLWILVEYRLGFRTRDFDRHLITSLFSVIVLIGGIIAAINVNKRQLGSKYGFKQGVGTGLLVSLVAGVIMVFGQYTYLGFIDKNYTRRAQAWSAYIQVLDGQTIEEARTNTDDGAWKYNIHVRALGQIPMFLVQGLIISAIAAPIITRKK
jgi:hypothetical protein